MLGDVTSTTQTGMRRVGVRQPVTTAGKRKSGPKSESNRGGDGEPSSSPSPPPRRITGSIRGISMRQQLDLVRRQNKVAKVSALVVSTTQLRARGWLPTVYSLTSLALVEHRTGHAVGERLAGR
jgi:hypothetical protein